MKGSGKYSPKEKCAIEEMSFLNSENLFSVCFASHRSVCEIATNDKLAFLTIGLLTNERNCAKNGV